MRAIGAARSEKLLHSCEPANVGNFTTECSLVRCLQSVD
jgi:hypothetical protein